jgi:hypothetical protein
MRHFWKSGLKEQKGEKLESVDAIECTSVQASKVRIECTYVRVGKKEIDCSAIERTKGDRAHLYMKPTPTVALFWKFLVFRCCTNLIVHANCTSR